MGQLPVAAMSAATTGCPSPVGGGDATATTRKLTRYSPIACVDFFWLCGIVNYLSSSAFGCVDRQSSEIRKHLWEGI